MKKISSVIISASLIATCICGCSTNKSINVSNETTTITENTVIETTVSKETTPKNQTVNFKDFTLTFPSNWIYTENETGVEFCEKTNYEQNFYGKLMNISTTTSNPEEVQNFCPYTVLGKQLGKYYVCYEPNGINYNYENEQLTNNYNEEKAKIQDVLKTFKLVNPYNEYGYTDFGLTFENALQNYEDVHNIRDPFFSASGESAEKYECRANNAVLVDKSAALTVLDCCYELGGHFNLYLNESGNVVYFSCYTSRDSELPIQDLSEWCLALTNTSVTENSTDSDLFVPIDKTIKELIDKREKSDDLYVTSKYEDLTLYCFYADSIATFDPIEVYDSERNVVNSTDNSGTDTLIEFSMIFSNDDFNKYYAEYLENH